MGKKKKKILFATLLLFLISGVVAGTVVPTIFIISNKNNDKNNIKKGTYLSKNKVVDFPNNASMYATNVADEALKQYILDNKILINVPDAYEIIDFNANKNIANGTINVKFCINKYINNNGEVVNQKSSIFKIDFVGFKINGLTTTVASGTINMSDSAASDITYEKSKVINAIIDANLITDLADGVSSLTNADIEITNFHPNNLNGECTLDIKVKNFKAWTDGVVQEIKVFENVKINGFRIQRPTKIKQSVLSYPEAYNLYPNQVNQQTILNIINQQKDSVFEWLPDDALLTIDKLIYNDQQAAVEVLINTSTWYDETGTYIDTQKTFSVVFKGFKKSLEQNKTQRYNELSLYYEKIVNKNIERKINNEYYSTSLEKQYSKYGFSYPGWDKNYEVGQNKFINVNGEKVNISAKVYNERVALENGEEVKYSDQRFINEEIANNRLKKHPAAKNFYKYNVSPDQKAVDKFFMISTAFPGIVPLGLYAPAGEIITLRFDDETFNLLLRNNFSNLKIVINDNYWDNYEEPNSGQISNRYPFIKTEFNINSNQKEIKFASPFGGSICLDIGRKLIDDHNAVYPAARTIKFNVIGAVEALHYVHGQTTLSQWMEDIIRVKNQELTAPVFQALAPYLSTNIPFSNDKQFVLANIKIDDLIFPYDHFSRWNDFMFLSYYFRGSDLSNDFRRLDFLACDDIWGGAGAWGGGWRLYCQPGWAGNAFFSKDPNWFSMANQWGTAHEINHNFEQNNVFFTKRSHGQTNQVNMYNFALIGNDGRFRQEIKPFSRWWETGWQRLSNSYSNIIDLLRRNWKYSDDDEYSLYANFMYTIGAIKYGEYVRYAARNFPNTDSGWTPLKQIINLSNYFKLDFYPAIENYTKYWYGNWPVRNPSDYVVNDGIQLVQATIDDINQINQLNSSFPAFDFLGNLYGCGTYLYDATTRDFKYTGDVIPAYEIEAGKNYTFNFDEFIKSANENFTWNNINIVQQPLYGNLSVDPLNAKNLIYQPNKQHIGDIDEFVISIIPGQWNNKPTNYVPEYRWKIKVRQVVNAAIVNTYKGNVNLTNNASTNFANLNSLQIDKFGLTNDLSGFHNLLLESKGRGKGFSINFKYLVPQDGIYKIEGKWDDQIDVVIDGRSVFQTNKWEDKWRQITRNNWKKGQVKDIKISVINDGGNGSLDIRGFLNDEPINILDNALIPNINNLNVESNLQNYIDNEKYKYHDRVLDYQLFNSLTEDMNTLDIPFDVINSSNYNFYSSDKWLNRNLQGLKDHSSGNRVESWNNSGQGAPHSINFDVTFNEPTKLRTLIFGHRTDNWWNGRPTKIKITNKETQEVLYDGEYGKNFNDRGMDVSHLVLDRDYIVSKINITLTNENIADWRGNRTSIIITYLDFSSIAYSPLGNQFSFINSNIDSRGNWNIVENDIDVNISYLNSVSICSTSTNDSLEFILSNVNRFYIVGQKNIDNGSFDVYINGVLSQTVNANDQSLKFNQLLYSYQNQQESEPIKVKIVHKDNKPIYLDYIGTVGIKTKIELPKQ